MTDEKRNYQVTDRRHSRLAEEASEPATAEPSAPSAAEPSSVEAPSHATGMPPADFPSFVMSLGTQAGMLLEGGEGHEPDLKGAQWLISILEMLQDKTEGRRTAEETDVLESILYQLRMGYLERMRGAGGS
jgi:hypothetical protein